MTCAEVKQHLAAYHDGELDADRRRAVDAHLAECAACRGELAGLVELSGVLQAGQSCRLPADLWPRIEAAAAARRPTSVRRWIASIGAVAAGFAIYLLGHSAVTPPVPSQQITQIDQTLQDAGLLIAGREIVDERLASLSQRPEVILVQRLAEDSGP